MKNNRIELNTPKQYNLSQANKFWKHYCQFTSINSNYLFLFKVSITGPLSKPVNRTRQVV